MSRLPRVLEDLPDRAQADSRREVVATQLRGLADLQDALGYQFARPALLRVALTHGSWAQEHPDEGWIGNANLEFFGDAILGLLAADAIWRRFPELDEGRLTRLRASVVSEPSLAAAAREIDLGRWLYLSKGQVLQEVRSHAGTLADAVEAVLAAVFLDARESGETGLVGARKVFDALLGERVQGLSPNDGLHPKARLQHWSQARFHIAPQYVRVGEDPDPGDPHWAVQVELHHPDGKIQVLGAGAGRSLRRAERAAASDALAKLSEA